MKVVIQRVNHGSVKVDNKIVAEIEKGMTLLVCCEVGDTSTNILKAAAKILALRIFSDDMGKLNQSILDIGGAALCVSQFTLSWDGKKGNRPNFSGSLVPNLAETLFDEFCHALSKEITVARGQFGADMKVSLENDGPVTFSLSF